MVPTPRRPPYELMRKLLFICAAAILCLGPLLVLGVSRSRLTGAQAAERSSTQEGPSGAPAAAEVTTDTLEYCNRLAQELMQAHYAPESALELRAEGQQLCQNGQIRGGILRLRRASVLMHGNTDR